jgi:hypothetical protein
LTLLKNDLPGWRAALLTKPHQPTAMFAKTNRILQITKQKHSPTKFTDLLLDAGNTKAWLEPVTAENSIARP